MLIVLGACGFESFAVPADAARDTTVRPPDAANAADAAIDSPLTTNPPSICDAADPNVIACYRFDGDTKDSTTHHLDATMTGVTFPAGQVGQAMLFGATSAADVADSPLFDVTALTLEAWIKPTQLPTNGNKAVILDVDRQYSLFLHADGSLTCVLVNGPPMLLATTVHVKKNQWTHVACTYDGDAAAIYIDGVANSTAAGGSTLGTNGTTGMSIAADNPPGSGSPLIGLIDELRIMSAARTATQICADAGKSSCP